MATTMQNQPTPSLPSHPAYRAGLLATCACTVHKDCVIRRGESLCDTDMAAVVDTHGEPLYELAGFGVWRVRL